MSIEDAPGAWVLPSLDPRGDCSLFLDVASFARRMHATHGHLAPTLAQLRAFACVVDAGSFSAAAPAMGVAQSSVSRAVRSLEASLGLVLLERASTGVQLTAPGEVVLRDVRHALALVDGLGRVGEPGGVTRTVTIGAFRSAVEQLLPRAVAQISREHTTLELRIQTIPERHGGVLRALASGAIDIGISSLPLPRTVIGTEILTDAYVRVEPIHTAARPLPFILWDEDCSLKALAWLQSQSVPPETTLRLDDDRAVLAHVSEGLGYSIMPALSTAGASGIRRRRIQDGPRRVVAICTTAAALRRIEVRTVYDRLRTHLENTGART